MLMYQIRYFLKSNSGRKMRHIIMLENAIQTRDLEIVSLKKEVNSFLPTTSDSLREEIEVEVAQKSEFPCMFCDFLTMIKNDLINHIKNVHDGFVKCKNVSVEESQGMTSMVDKFKCYICDFAARTEDKLKKHWAMLEMTFED